MPINPKEPMPGVLQLPQAREPHREAEGDTIGPDEEHPAVGTSLRSNPLCAVLEIKAKSFWLDVDELERDPGPLKRHRYDRAHVGWQKERMPCSRAPEQVVQDRACAPFVADHASTPSRSRC